MSDIKTSQELRSLYNRAGERSVLKELSQLDTHATRFISLSPFALVSTNGMSGAAGFVKVLDAQTMLIPDSPGNNRLDSLENIIATGHIGLLFLVPGVDETLRDQMADRVSPGTAFESQEQMLERYRLSL